MTNMINIKIIFMHLMYVLRNYLRKIYYKNNEKEK